MSELRDYIEKYVQDLTDILERTTDDEAFLDLAEEKWKLDDPRLLAIKAPVSGQLFPVESEGTDKSDTDNEQN
ncbi:MAG: hypothetical protein BWK78_09590 [Thiotrichaceae bacterium IS1]|nr:MAG: hypothetical protein BWK78_09590 [Thiotrichaceae bacterium IS1]